MDNKQIVELLKWAQGYIKSCNEKALVSRSSTLSIHEEFDQAIQALEGRGEGEKEIIEAVAHIGVDFGYGPFELNETHIKKARELLDATTPKVTV